MKIIITLLTLLLSTAATQAADTVFVNLGVISDTTVRMTSNGNSSTGEAAKKMVVSGLLATDTLRVVRWDKPGNQDNEQVEVFGLTAGGWTWLSLEGDLPNGDTMIASFAGYESYLIRHIGGLGPGSQWVNVQRIQPTSAFPVEWLSFHAEQVGSNVELSWATAQEINSDRFEVERSTNGRNWETIGSVTAAGLADSRSDYDFTDSSAPAAGKVAYRLRQVDLDGDNAYSNVVELAIQAEETFKISSLVDGSGAYVHGLSGRGTVQVYNLDGQLATSQVISGSGSVDIGLPAGTYTVRVSDGAGGQGVGKIIIGR